MSLLGPGGDALPLRSLQRPSDFDRHAPRDHLGLYGYPRATSPHLDALAKESVVFDAAYAQAGWTLPSHMTLFTSLYPPVHGMTTRDLGEKRRRLHPDWPTLAGALKSHGYATAGFVGGLGQDGSDVHATYGFGQGFDEYESSQGFAFQETIPRAEQWLAEHQNKGPFFLFVHGYDVHSPYLKKAIGPDHTFDPSYSGTVDRALAKDLAVFLQRDKEGYYLLSGGYRKRFSQRDAEHIIAHYDSGVARADRLVGEFLDRHRDLLANTLVIIMSDHGEALGGGDCRVDSSERCFNHGGVLDAILRVVLLVHGPHLSPLRNPSPVGLIDVTPTILGVLGLPVPGTMQGASLASALRGAQAPQRDIWSYSDGWSSVHSGGWKLIEAGDGDGESVRLSDMAHDPMERQNLLGTRVDIRKALEQKARDQKVRNDLLIAQFPRAPIASGVVDENQVPSPNWATKDDIFTKTDKGTEGEEDVLFRGKAASLRRIMYLFVETEEAEEYIRKRVAPAVAYFNPRSCSARFQPRVDRRQDEGRLIEIVATEGKDIRSFGACVENGHFYEIELHAKKGLATPGFVERLLAGLKC